VKGNTEVKNLPRIVWESPYARVVAVECEPYNPDEERKNPFLRHGEEWVVEVERGRDSLGAQRWERVDFWSDRGMSRGDARAIVGALLRDIVVLTALS